MSLVGVLCWVFVVYPATNVWLILSIKNSAPADVAQWIECWPANGEVFGLSPCQGTCLGCRSLVEGLREATD